MNKYKLLAPSFARRLQTRLRHRFYKREILKIVYENYLCGGVENLVIKDQAVGLFAVYSIALGALELQRLTGCGVRFDFTRAPYAKGVIARGKLTTWWDYYFPHSVFPVTPHQQKKQKNEATMGDRFHLDRLACMGKTLPRTQAAKRCEMIGIQPDIEEVVDMFADKRFHQNRIIGIHYRGTDKNIQEAVRVPYEFVFLRIKERLQKLPPDSSAIFIATDEDAFLQMARQHFTDLPILSYDLTRSKDGEALHIGASEDTVLERGREALIDALLLSRCDELFRTESNLSGVSCLFNPALRMHNLTTDYRMNYKSCFEIFKNIFSHKARHENSSQGER